MKGKDLAIRILLFPRCLSGPVGAAGKSGALGQKSQSLGARHGEAHIGDRQHGGGDRHKVQPQNIVPMKVAFDLGRQAGRQEAEMPRSGTGSETESLGLGLYWSCSSCTFKAMGEEALEGGPLLTWIKVMSQVGCSSWRDWAVRQTGLAPPAGKQRRHGVQTLLGGFKWARLARNGSTHISPVR